MSPVTAVVVTRGDVDLTEIMESLGGFDEILVANNSIHVQNGDPDLGSFFQYQDALKARNSILYFQDDDVVVSFPEWIVEAWESGIVTCNMPQEYRPNYEGQPDRLMGFGSVFSKWMIAETLDRYRGSGFQFDSLFYREPGRVFTGLNRCKLVDVPIRHLPWATADYRLYRQPEHIPARDQIRDRIRSIVQYEARCD